MITTEIGQQQYVQALEQSLRIIRNTDRLSLEASIEELCKIQLMMLYFERKNEVSLLRFVEELKTGSEDVKYFYERYYRTYVPALVFKGWEQLYASKSSFLKVVETLSEDSLFHCKRWDKAIAFSDFLQLHYAGYLSEYSTPEVLCRFINKALGTEEVLSLVDPCCGLGGMLVEALKQRNSQLKVKGFDVNQRMANTANLQLLMYGYYGTSVECKDVLETSVAYMDGPYEAIAAHLPLRHRAFSIAGRRNDGVDRMFSKIQEDFFISQILKMLQPGGVAALVVSDELLTTERRAESRRWLYKNAQVLNITRFEGLSYKGSSNVRAYNVVFIKKLVTSISDVCMATLIKEGTPEEDIMLTALQIRKVICEQDSHLDFNSQYFSLLKEDVWNVNLLFARERMGAKYPTRLLKDLVAHDRERARVKDARNYKQLTVRSKGLGVVERDSEYIGSTASKNVRYIARSGQVVMSSLEADKGATGIVPKDLNNALVSSNYYLFTIVSPDVDPDYLVMVLSSEPVLKQLRLNKRGFVMSRISIEKVLSLVIPLPSLEEQRMLAGKLMRKVKRVQQIQDELEKEQKEFAWNLFGEE